MKAKMRYAVLSLGFGLAGLAWWYIGFGPCAQNVEPEPSVIYSSGMPPGWEHQALQMRDPASGDYHPAMTHEARAYTRTLPKHTEATSLFHWESAGPDIFGGRTLALAIDVTEPNTVLAGSPSGGIWRSENRGDSWTLVTQPGDPLTTTSLAQDPRPGNTHIWYATGGELRGSAGSIQNISLGNYAEGMYRSEDGGRTWNVLPNTIQGDPRQFDSPFDYTSKVVVNPITGSVFVASHAHGILRSTDGGDTFEQVVGGPFGQHLYCDIAAAPTGRLLASLSALSIGGTFNNQGGYFVSDDDGVTWRDVKPAALPARHQISRVALAPSNPNVAYTLSLTNRTSTGETFHFFKHDLDAGTAENRSTNMPRYPGVLSLGAQLNSLNNFTLVLAVKPDDDDFVVLGGNSFYRSRDGWATRIPTYEAAAIGGYRCATGGCVDPVYGISYPRHYSDMHAAVFSPHNANELWSAHDAGVSVTTNAEADVVRWQSTYQRYTVSQFYRVALPNGAGDRRLMGGMQDAGVHYVVERKAGSSTLGSRFSPGERLSNDDGAYVFFSPNYAVVGLSFGKIHRLPYQDSDKLEIEGLLERVFSVGQNFVELRPAQATGYKNYVHPMALDPVDGKTLYYSDGSANGITATVWRNSNINGSTPQRNWRRMDEWAAPAGFYYTAYGTSLNPAHVLYLGASSFVSAIQPKVYRIENAPTATTAPVEVSIPEAVPGGFIEDIAVNPLDADEIMVVFSNYNVIGLYHSRDGGQSYTAVEGNLAGPNNSGPSLRSASILPLTQVGDTQTVYLLGTSAGLFSTTMLNGNQTTWTQEALDEIGSVTVNHVLSRPSDGRVLLGTHGRGMLVGDLDPLQVSTEASADMPSGFGLAPAYPNPFRHSVQVPFDLDETSHVTLKIYDVQGRLVDTLQEDALYPSGRHEVTWSTEAGAAGTYLARLEITPLSQPQTQYQVTRGMLRVP